MASELAIEIAKLQGWTDINTGSPGAIGHYGIHSKHLWKARVPEPDVNPADCLELLRYLLTKGFVPMLWLEEETGRFVCHLGQSKTWEDTLEEAVALAARDALKSLGG